MRPPSCPAVVVLTLVSILSFGVTVFLVTTAKSQMSALLMSLTVLSSYGLPQHRVRAIICAPSAPTCSSLPLIRLRLNNAPCFAPPRAHLMRRVAGFLMPRSRAALFPAYPPRLCPFVVK